MTVTEWLTATEPTPMVEFLRGKASDRKLRLFAVGSVLPFADLLPDSRSRRALQAAEEFADGRISAQELELAHTASWSAVSELPLSTSSALVALSKAVAKASDHEGWWAAEKVRDSVVDFEGDVSETGDERDLEPSEEWMASAERSRVRMSDLVRDIFGNPFQPVVFDPSWLTPTAVTLAESIYRDRAFDRLPILADALEEAGCDHFDVLAHCRGEGTHVRGCWVIDLVLGKK
jgi:hypothetical protein